METLCSSKTSKGSSKFCGHVELIVGEYFYKTEREGVANLQARMKGCCTFVLWASVACSTRCGLQPHRPVYEVTRSKLGSGSVQAEKNMAPSLVLSTLFRQASRHPSLARKGAHGWLSVALAPQQCGHQSFFLPQKRHARSFFSASTASFQNQVGPARPLVQDAVRRMSTMPSIFANEYMRNIAIIGA